MTASSDTYSGYDHIEPFRCQRAYPKDNYLPFIRLLNYIFVMTHLIANLNFYLFFGNLPFQSLWYGMDGLKGPIVSGTNFYMKREALYSVSKQEGKFASN